MVTSKYVSQLMDSSISVKKDPTRPMSNLSMKRSIDVSEFKSLQRVVPTLFPFAEQQI